MASVFLGHDADNGKRILVPADSFRTHWHLIGATGKGKTTAIEALLHQLFMTREKATHFIFDRMGSFSYSLLRYLASPYCPKWVKDRVLYLDASREDLILPFNPLLYDTLAHGYYKVSRACDVILRAWSSQAIQEMPRLARWLFNAIWATAQLGLTVADSAHLLMPGSPFHEAILHALPPLLRAEFAEVENARGGEAARILESSRNRIKPFNEFPILRGMFGSVRNRLDILRLLREDRIVIIDLAPKSRLSPQAADAIGGMILNEIFATLRSLPGHLRFRTYLWLDEFQHYVSNDIEESIPIIRQLGGRLILAHQSFSQLIKGEIDLQSLIWQPQSRMMFGVQGEDAEILANEVASLKFNPKQIKDETYTRRQLVKGHRKVLTSSWSESESDAKNWQTTYGTNWSATSGSSQGAGWNQSDSKSTSRPSHGSHPDETLSDTHSRGRSGNSSENRSKSDGGSSGSGQGGSHSTSSSQSTNETFLPVYDEFLELSRRTYYSFDEQRALWAQKIRLLQTGQTLLKLVNDPNLYRVNVQRHTPGYLGSDVELLARRNPAALEAVQRFIDQNYTQDFFVAPAIIEQETEQRLERILRPVIVIPDGENSSDQRGLENPLA